MNHPAFACNIKIAHGNKRISSEHNFGFKKNHKDLRNL